MRNISPRILIVSAFFTGVVAINAMAPVVRPAMADPQDMATYDAEFQRIKSEMKDLWLEMHNFKPLPKYCRPPLEPMKFPHTAAMQAFGARTQALLARFRATKQSLQDFLAGNHEIESRVMRDDEKGFSISPRDEKWWKDSPYVAEADRLQRKFNEKDAELKAKPERNCAPPPPKKEFEVIGSNPPPVEPPPPPPPPPPPVDPLKGLTRPPIRGVKFPKLENHYCSQAEKDAVLALFPPEIAKVNANIADVDAYIASLNTRRGELKARGVEQHWLDSMDYEIRQAEVEKASHRTSIPSLETARRLVASTPVVDCSTEGKKEIGSLPGWSAGIEAAYGDLKIPKKPYLSLDVGGNQYLGVVDHKREESIARLLLSLTHEFDCDEMPTFRLGDPRNQRWMSSAEVFGYDYRVFSSNGSINTTTEGLGIPGTGDPMANYPAGVFFGLPAINDVTDLDYGHKSELDGLSLGLAQKSTYNGWSSTLGIGVSYTRLETSDTLSGSIPGYGWNFQYMTDIETRNFGAFVKGGAEIEVDQFWDSALRYAGEFSGFRIGVEAKAGANFLGADGTDRLDLSGGLGDAQRIRISKDDTTFGYQLGASLKYVPPGVEALELSIVTTYGESDTHPDVNRSGQTGERSQIEFETQEEFVGTLGTRFKF